MCVLIFDCGRINTRRTLGSPRLDRSRAAERSNEKDEETGYKICRIIELPPDVSMEFGLFL